MREDLIKQISDLHSNCCSPNNISSLRSNFKKIIQLLLKLEEIDGKSYSYIINNIIDTLDDEANSVINIKGKVKNINSKRLKKSFDYMIQDLNSDLRDLYIIDVI